MIIIGHKDLEYKPFYMIGSAKDIKKTPSNSTVIFEFDISLCKFCLKNSVSFATIVKDTKEILFASALEASFIVGEKPIAKKAQKLADEYMFDAKILLLCKDEEQMVWASKKAIDGVLFGFGIVLKDTRS